MTTIERSEETGSGKRVAIGHIWKSMGKVSTVAKFLCKTKKPQSEVVATQVKRKGGG